ncbi:MAG: twin-arginine translocation signal domain-containing protein, partial [Planctomycetaceae bacterium]|nr:twin-arginine translocation signal domain-containing protein [Planctomycetaceae bacterium]
MAFQQPTSQRGPCWPAPCTTSTSPKHGNSFMNDTLQSNEWAQARRQFLKTSGMGLGATVLGALLPQNTSAREPKNFMTGEP